MPDPKQIAEWRAVAEKAGELCVDYDNRPGGSCHLVRPNGLAVFFGVSDGGTKEEDAEFAALAWNQFLPLIDALQQSQERCGKLSDELQIAKAMLDEHQEHITKLESDQRDTLRRINRANNKRIELYEDNQRLRAIVDAIERGET